MTFAIAREFDFSEIDGDSAEPADVSGAHTLLALPRARPSYVTQAIAIGLYALALVGLCYLARPKPVPQDQPIELTMVADDTPTPAENLDAAPTPPAVTEQAPTPPADPAPPEETALATPDTPPAQDLAPPLSEQQEAVAPVAPPPPPKPVKQAKPKEKPARPTVAARTPAARRAAGGAPSSAASNAVPSYYANEVHARIARVAGETISDDFHGSGRVAYHLVIAPSGAVISKSISSSGNPAFDRAASAALARAAPFPPTGVARPVSLHGAIAYSQ